MARKNQVDNGTVLVEPDEMSKYITDLAGNTSDDEFPSGEGAGQEDRPQDDTVQENFETGSEVPEKEPEGALAWHSSPDSDSVPQLSDTEMSNEKSTLYGPDLFPQSVNGGQNEDDLGGAEGSGAARRGINGSVSEIDDTASELNASSADGLMDRRSGIPPGSVLEIDDTASERSDLPVDEPMDQLSGMPPGVVSDNGDTGSGEAAARRRRRRQTVFSIDGQRSVQTEADRRRNDLIDMAESMKSGKILTGIVQGIERPEDNPNLSYAVLYHGTIKVIIPAQAMIDMPPEDWDEQSYAYRASMIVKRLGAEIDYVIKGVDPDNGIAAGSRVEAMAMRRREYLTATDRSGMYILNEDAIAEMRVVSVIRAGIFVDCFGLEAFIPLNELNYQRWVDAQDHFYPGDRVLTRILELNRSDRRDIKVRLSVKQAGEDSFTRAVSRYKTDNNYVGTVSVITQTGIFVNLDGVDCLCRFPKRGRPAVGARVTVKLLGIDIQSKRIWGVILR